ncbi:HD domain-containing protein [Metabacillus sp. GX 13764]|uniref:HD domain-containing phosphohydrolase n=1 Tax=Metabacillus kandeliae TaxID=2900151 RepID=UPI001E3E9D79|nr:HD domain-containing phosphohydrolase [Metabacillus kandeliae]MCD7035974.1 HD domain-containing protein [Metabacillus kandeliae]
MNENQKKIFIGDQLERDLLHDGRLILKQGTIIDTQLKSRLNKWGIYSIPKKPFSPLPSISRLKEKILEKNLSSEELLIQTLYLDTLLAIADEKRYGYSLNDEEKIEELGEIFFEAMSNQVIYTKMMELKQKDYHSFLHSVDVFILYTLFAQSMKVKETHFFGKAALLHDIGKAEIPEQILTKKGKLTIAEFELMKEHTTIGSKLLMSNKDTALFADFAMNHHERLDGSGYPAGVTSEYINLYIKALMIVDVYSALTLMRSYREPMPALQALEIFISENEKYDGSLLGQFMNMLHIYPVGSLVELSDGRIGNVIDHSSGLPFLAVIEEKGTLQEIEIPSNLSLNIKRAIHFDNTNGKTEKKLLWKSFINHLLIGNKEGALYIFEQLTDGKRAEEIYYGIFASAMKQVIHLKEQQIVTSTNVFLADDTVCTLMNFKLSSYVSTLQTFEKVLIATPIGEDLMFPSKLINDYLMINGWETVRYEGSSVRQMLKILQSCSTKYICFSITSPVYIEEISNLIDSLKLLKPDLVILVIYEFLENCKELLSKLDADLIAGSSQEMLEKLSIMHRVQVNGSGFNSRKHN